MVPRSRRPAFPLAALAAVFLACAAAAPQPARAADQSGPDPPRATSTGVSFSLELSGGVVEGTASRLALTYPHGERYKLSELTWELKDVVMVGLKGTMSVGRRFRFDLDVWTASTEGTGMMTDRDWNYSDELRSSVRPDDGNWTDESRHPDTSIDAGSSFDLSANVLAVQTSRYIVRGIVGYRYESWLWSARGGSFVYSTGDGASRDATGSFPAGQEVITYEQQYSIPYFGIGADWLRSGFGIAAYVLYSPVVSAVDSDYHVLRGVRFEGDFNGGTYLALGTRASWAFAARWSAALGVEYESIPEVTGDVSMTGAEGSGSFPGGGAIAMSATRYSLGVGYRF